MTEDKTFDEPYYAVPVKDPSASGHYAGFKRNETRPVPVVAPNDPTQKRVWAKATLSADGKDLRIVVTRSDGKTQSHSWQYDELKHGWN
jgi:hypothetical protein